MRNQAVAHIYGHGKSRSKPLRQKSYRNIMKQHKGHIKLSKWLDDIIKQSAPVKKIHMKKLRFAIKNGIRAMVYKKPIVKKKLRINTGLK